MGEKEYEYIFQIAKDCDGVYCYIKQGELIRCGECIYRYVEGKKVRFNRCRLDHNNLQSDDWYCADGIRRTND